MIRRPRKGQLCANGVPGGAYVQDVGGPVVRRNPRLEPETGYTLGAGLIYTPVWAKGLSASVDYFQENHTNYITSAHPLDILSVCADFGSSLCEAITRLPDGRVSHVAATYDNFGESEVRAFDFAINWSAMTQIGEVKSRLLATYLDRWDRQLFPGDEVYHTRANSMRARPRWRASGTSTALRAWIALRRRIYRQLLNRRTLGAVPAEFEPFDRRVDPVLYHDIEAWFKFDSGIALRAVISNGTDEDPPYLNIAPANTDVATYRLLGRSYFLELRYQVE
jgi:outer membrane receptor protein involved in Fe transport